MKSSRVNLSTKNKKSNWFANLRQKFNNSTFAKDERMKKYDEAHEVI